MLVGRPTLRTPDGEQELRPVGLRVLPDRRSGRAQGHEPNRRDRARRDLVEPPAGRDARLPRLGQGRRLAARQALPPRRRGRLLGRRGLAPGQRRRGDGPGTVPSARAARRGQIGDSPRADAETLRSPCVGSAACARVAAPKLPPTGGLSRHVPWRRRCDLPRRVDRRFVALLPRARRGATGTSRLLPHDEPLPPRRDGDVSDLARHASPQSTLRQAFNDRYDARGHLFQGRFHARSSNDAPRARLRYVLDNPVRAGSATRETTGPGSAESYVGLS